MIKTKINLFALWKNSENHIQRTLYQLDNLLALPEFEFHMFFYSNDNRDRTHEILLDWKKTHPDSVIEIVYEVLNAPSFGSITSNLRTSLLGFFRNKCKSMGENYHSEFSLVIDTDLEWTNKDFLSLYNNFRRKSPPCVGITGSTIQNVPDFVENLEPTSFYDIFPFRDKDGNQGCYFSRTPFYLNEDREEFLAGCPVQISSGFGGMALYDSSAYESCWYSGEFGSEHQSFSYQLRNYGPLYVDPNCKPVTTIDLSLLSMDNCRKLGEQYAQKMREINKLREWSLNMQYKFEFIQKKS
jgi:hypothetical protein